MKKTKITFGKIGIGVSLNNAPLPTPSAASDSANSQSSQEIALTQSNVGAFGTFGKSPDTAEKSVMVNVTNDASIAEDESDELSKAMGFAGFGKKAREFDLEKLAEDSRKEAAERNRLNIEKLSLEASAEKEKEENGNVMGPPPPPGLAKQQSTHGEAEDDEEIIGPPLPPHMLHSMQDTTKSSSACDDSDDEDDDDFGYKLPVSHELSLGHGSKPVNAVAMDVSGSRLVSGSADYDVKYWDFQGMDVAREPFRTFCPHDGYPVRAVDYSCTGDKVLVITGAPQAKVYDRDGIELFECGKGDMYLQDMRKTKGHISGITHGCWHPKHKEEFLTSSLDGTCRIWHTSKPSCQKHVIKPRAVSGLKVKPTSCCYSSDGLTVACVGNDGSIQMWDHRKNYVNTILNIRDCHMKGTETSSICFSYDNKYYATRGMDDTLKLWDIRKPTSSVFSATGLFNRFDMTECLFSPNDQLVVTGTSMNRGDTSGKLVMFNRNTWKLEHHMDVGNSHVVSIVWHPRLNQICVGSGDGKIRILYDPALSRNGAILAAGKRKKRYKDSGVVVSQQIITPHALPLFREERHKSTRKLELRDRKDPVKSHQPDLPLGNAGTGGRVSAGGSTLSSYIIRNLGLQNKKIEDDEGDPREALLKYDKLAKEDPYWVSPAYAVTQPIPIFKEDEQTQKNKKQKTDN
uniref:WD repeat-containing protein 70-like n=1 Tax=Hirondellea gigas TaxID=1518452 RepID=A0A2P2I4G1_9CRUS